MKRATELACIVSVRRLPWSIYSHFCRNSPFKCAPQPQIAKNTKSPYFGASRSFKVIDVNTAKQLVTSACYDKQDVYAYLQPFSLQTRQYR